MIINSILDQDLYKLTMQNGVIQHFPTTRVKYEFKNRGDHKFSEEFADRLYNEIYNMRNLKLTRRERAFLKCNCPYLTAVYLDILEEFTFDPSNINFNIIDGDLKLSIEGLWDKTILWEVPLMALISELYFENYTLDPYRSVHKKSLLIKNSGIKVTDFGTRRRHSHYNHRLVLVNMRKNLVGTSNVRLAQELGMKPFGTFAHEWVQAMAVIYGYEKANEMALKHWVETYQGDLGIALSDTFTTEVFFKSFNMKWAKLYDGVRHDSGDPYEFTDKIIEHYRSLNIDPMTKIIVFSDGLNVPEAIKIAEYCDNKIKCSFGIGTNLTNDVGVKPLNMVIKLTGLEVDGVMKPAIKLSDTAGKHNGDLEEIKRCKEILL